MRPPASRSRAHRALLAWLVLQQIVSSRPASAADVIAFNLQVGKPLGPSAAALSPEASTAGDIDADLFTGQARVRVPILAPPGTGGLTPQVAFSYGSHASNQDGPLGSGWSIDIGPSVIQRSTREGAPSYTSADSFALGDQDLIETATPGHYVTANFDHSRIEHVVASGGVDYWRVLRPDGTRLYYGYQPSDTPVNRSRVTSTIVRAEWHTPASCPSVFDIGDPFVCPWTATERIIDLDRAAIPFSWHLDRVEDRNGNVLRYRWSSLGDSGTTYLVAIEYSEHVAGVVNQLPAFATGDDGSLLRRRSIQFEYQLARPEAVPTFRTGFERVVRHRLSDVFVEVDAEPVRHYVLEYVDSAISGRSLLDAIHERDSQDVEATQLTHRFRYTDGTASGWEGVLDSTHVLPASLTFVTGQNRDRGVRVFDVNGDGWADVVQGSSSTRRTFLGGPTGFGAEDASWMPPDAFVDSNGYTGLVVAHLDGDGLPDFARRTLQISGSLRRDDGCGANVASYQNERLGSTGHSERAWLNTGLGWDPESSVEDVAPAFSLTLESTSSSLRSCPTEYLPTVESLQGISAQFDQAVRFADVNGDGRDDIVYRRELSSAQLDGSNEYTVLDLRAGSVINPAAGFAGADLNVFHDGYVDRNGNLAFTGKLHDLPTWQVPAMFEADELYDVAWSKLVACRADNKLVGAYSGSERIVDLNGDGLPEILQGANFTPGPSPRTAWLNNGYTWRDPFAYGFPLSQWSPRHDFVEITDGGYLINTSLDECAVDEAWDTGDAGARLVDLNGDGGVDVVNDGSSVSRRSALWNARLPAIWQEATAWNAPLDFATGSGDTDSSWRLVDVNADGMVDVLEPDGARLNRARAPDKLEEIDSPYGAVTTIRYEPNTITDVGPMPSANPEVDGQRRAGTPIWVVASIDVDPGFGQPPMSRAFRFYEPTYDVEDRAFRGFGAVEIEGSEVNGVVRRDTIEYHTRDAMRGNPKRTEVAQSVGGGSWTVLEESLYGWSAASAADTNASFYFGGAAPSPIDPAQASAFAAFRAWVGNSSPRAHLAFGSAVERVHYGPTGGERRLRREAIYDVFGNPTVERNLADAADANDDVTTTRSFTLLDTTIGGQPVFLADRPTSVTLSGVQGWLPAGSTLSRTVSFFYDGATAPGVLTRGNPTRTELGWTRDGVPTVLRTVRTFDSYGNERSLISPRDPADTGTEARWLRSTLYDTASYTFPTRISETSYGAPAVDNLEIQLEYEGIVGCGAPKGLGLACEVTGPSEQPTTSFYDGFGRLVRREAPNGSQTAVLYRDLGMAGQRIETRTRWSVDGASGSALESDPAALIAETYFDGLGRPVLETRSGQGSNVARRFLSYDAAGRLASASRWDFAGTAVYPTLFRYDGLGRETLVTLPGGSTVASSYNATSVFQVATEGIAQISKRETWSDGHGRVLAIDEYPSVTSTSHERTVFLYDPFGQLALVGDPITQNPSLCGTNPACPGQRHSTAILYDELGNPTRRDEPDAGTWSWRYNAAGLIDEQQDPAGQVLTYGYDFMGRLQVVHPVDLPVPEADRVFVYGPGNDSDTSRRGRLVEVYDDEGYDTFAYDDAGNVAEHVRAVDGRRFPFQREYDPLGRVRLAIYPDGEWVTWEYDKALVSRISGQYGEYSGDYLASATYDALDRPTNLELGGSAGDAVLEQSWIHDPVTGHLDRSTAVLGETGATLATLNYTFDDFGRLERYEQTWRTNPPPDGTEFERRLFFEHDGLGRIKQIEDPLCGAIPIYCIYDYAYDAVGNITLMGVNEFNNGHDLEYRDPLRPHALTAAVPRGGSLRRDLAYDAAGRVGEETFSGVGGATRSFAYDAYGLPAQAGSLYFGYDWRGQRVRSYAKPDGSDGKSAHPEPDYSYQNGNSNKHFFVAGARIASSKRFFIPESASAPVVFTWRGPHLPVWSTTVSLGVAWGSIVSLLLGIAIRRSSRHPLRLRLGSVGVIALAAPMLLAGRPRVNFGIHETTVLFYATDHLGSTILAVKPTSGSANPIHLHSLHAPFGGTLLQGGATTLEKRWIGASRLPAGTGDYELYALGPRLYSPLAGHFYQPDPLLGSGDEPQTWNPYAYAANAPVERKDASGFCVGEPPCGPPVPTPSGDDEYHADASPDWTQSRGPGSVREHLFPLRTGGGGAPSMATNVTSPRVDVWSQSSAAAADPCAGGACGAHDVFDFLYALPVAGRALGAAGTAAAIRVAVPLAVRFPGTAAVLGFGAPAALVSRAGEVGRATGNLGTVLTPALERTVNSVLRGSEPLSALTVQQRQVSAVFFQNVATRSSVLATKGAAEFNIARARFLEGLSSTPPGLLAEFLARQGGH